MVYRLYPHINAVLHVIGTADLRDGDLPEHSNR